MRCAIAGAVQVRHVGDGDADDGDAEHECRPMVMILGDASRWPRRRSRRLPARSCLIDREAIVTDQNGLAVFDLIRGHRPSVVIPTLVSHVRLY
jgi:hypothetical protein